LSTRLFLNLATALAYASTGWLSLQISIPPDYISLVFLPAGVALAAVLIWGTSLLPGVFAGSLLIQILALQRAGDFDWTWAMAISPMGAALQAWVTAWVVWRFVGYPSAMDTPRRVLVFMFAVIPLGCLVNASISVPVLVWNGVIPATEALFSWWTWWLGDSLGVILMAPILLALLGEPADVWRPRLRTVALPMTIALLLAGMSYYQLRMGETRALHNELDEQAHAMTRDVQRRLDAQTDSVVAIAKLLELAPALSAGEFREATQPWLNRYGGTQNYGWSPLVSHAERASFEAMQRQAGRADFAILGRTPDGETFPAQPAQDYLPITLVEPLETNLSVVGLDVSVLPATRAAVQATRLSGRPEVTEGLRLVQESGEQRGVVMYQGVYARQPGVDGSTSMEGTRLLGVVSAVFRMDDVLTAVLGDIDTTYWTLCLIDLSSGTPQRLHGPADCASQAGHGGRGEVLAWAGERPLRFGEQSWVLRITAGPGHLAQARNWTAWGSMGIGFLAVAMLGAFLMVISGQARRTQVLVDQRTQELARSNAILAQLAHFDPLTGLSNRAHWMQQADAALDAARRDGGALAVMFLDLDRFKHINDSLGHDQGDQLLRVVAQRLRDCLRARDVLARLGGDEFVVLLPRLRDRDGAVAAAQKIVHSLSLPIALEPHEVTVSASLGLAYFPGDGESVEALLRHADTAMYAAKDAGRNGWRFFSPEMTEHLSQRLLIEAGLRRALQSAAEQSHQDNRPVARRAEETGLRLEYQPQIEAATGRVLGVEALLRWNDGELGAVPPDSFIPVAEDSGLIEPLGQWVLSEACRQLHEWQTSPAHRAMRGLKLAVNISALEFNRPRFVQSLQQAVERVGTRADLLELEITESLLMQPLPDLNERLGELRNMGVTLALDDFGTGYSSMGYLRRLPLGKLKIDRSFLADVPGNPEDEAIVRATLSMARALGLTVVAEGVETTAQRDFLLRHRCDSFQGWLFARSLHPTELLRWVEEQGPALGLAWDQDAA